MLISLYFLPKTDNYFILFSIFSSSEGTVPDHGSSAHSGNSAHSHSFAEYTRDHLVRGQRRINSLVQHTRQGPVDETLDSSPANLSESRTSQRPVTRYRPPVSLLSHSCDNLTTPVQESLKSSCLSRPNAFSGGSPARHTSSSSRHFQTPEYQTSRSPSYSYVPSRNQQRRSSVHSFYTEFQSETKTDNSGTVTNWSKGSKSYNMTRMDPPEANELRDVSGETETLRPSPTALSEQNSINLDITHCEDTTTAVDKKEMES